MSNNFNQKVKQVKRLVFIGIILLVMINFVGCSKGGGGSSSGDGSSGSVKNVGKTSPASDFQYDLTEDGKGISIRKYKGKGGKVVIPAKIEDYPVVEIANRAFMGQTHKDYFDANEITDVVIPNSVVKIGDGAFLWIENLKSANIPASIKSIGGGAFGNCDNLETLTIPASLTKIDFENSAYILMGGGSLLGGTAYKVFTGCGKLPIKTRQRLKELGYEHDF